MLNCLLTGEVPCRIGGKCISESDLSTHVKLFINRRGALSYRR